ncbi:MAG TPA: hypothetical protein VJ895_00715 [Candidatus Nanoarchaeia archaeon]|nr:hypothetical protein [Candidatus Nanoarchaeia archaeon]
MGKIRCLDNIKKLTEFHNLQKDEFILIRGKIEKILEVKEEKFLTTLKTIKTEQGEMNLRGNYIIESQYNFYKEEDFLVREPSKIIFKKVEEKYYNNLEKTLTNSFYSHSF